MNQGEVTLVCSKLKKDCFIVELQRKPTRQVNGYNWPPVQPGLGFIYEHKKTKVRVSRGGVLVIGR